MGAYVLFVWAIVATGALIWQDYKSFNKVGTLGAALSFASHLHDSECRTFVRLFMGADQMTLTRRFPSWPAYRDNFLGIEGDGR